MLRSEVAQLRSKQERSDVVAPGNPEMDGVIQREIALLRGEMEELRIVQQMDSLPAYTPPSPLALRRGAVQAQGR